MSVIARKPVSPPAKSPVDDRYFDPRDLEAELKRTFQICHECRMCVNYCGSFPELFRRIDGAIESGRAEGAETVDYDTVKAVSDQCWQCKLCYIKCPYTEDENAEELLDFPRLMSREKAVRAAREGIPLVDRLLGEPQLVGALGSGIAASASNFVLASKLVRKAQEAVTGISAEFPLPPFASESFSTWFRKRELSLKKDAPQVVLFATCYGEFNTPSIAIAATKVLEHQGFQVVVPGVSDDNALTCCGMPNLDGGDVQAFNEKVKRNVATLLPYAKAGTKIVVLGPTCGYTMKNEWSEYVPTDEVKLVAQAVMDAMEFLAMLGKQKMLKREFKKGLGTVGYHAACHLRAQKIGFPGARVLSVIQDTDVRVIEQCSAVDGTWGMKAKHYETGRKYAQRLVREVSDLEPDLMVGDCTLAGLRVAHENNIRVMHPIEALAEAYGL